MVDNEFHTYMHRMLCILQLHRSALSKLLDDKKHTMRTHSHGDISIRTQTHSYTTTILAENEQFNESSDKYGTNLTAVIERLLKSRSEMMLLYRV